MVRTAGIDKEYADIRDLILKEQTLNACLKELAAHLREQKDQSLQALADAAKRYLEAHNMKFANKAQRVLTDERHDENTNGRGGAPGHITCFKCGSLGHKAARCPRQLSRDGYPRRQD
ncbi:hypothetical protein RRG08_003971 [Elysia crispata]|uniref:CCHC-type domain-containing protein n=1 Tax=Elysia crispata TaxID=231223 RepID=A0AAE0ZDQ6_9GAST|nr:hypothetical protein RRG08_003971 [Elysia crispata]